MPGPVARLSRLFKPRCSYGLMCFFTFHIFWIMHLVDFIFTFTLHRCFWITVFLFFSSLYLSPHFFSLSHTSTIMVTLSLPFFTLSPLPIRIHCLNSLLYHVETVASQYHFLPLYPQPLPFSACDKRVRRLKQPSVPRLPLFRYRTNGPFCSEPMRGREIRNIHCKEALPQTTGSG